MGPWAHGLFAHLLAPSLALLNHSLVPRCLLRPARFARLVYALCCAHSFALAFTHSPRAHEMLKKFDIPSSCGFVPQCGESCRKLMLIIQNILKDLNLRRESFQGIFFFKLDVRTAIIELSLVRGKKEYRVCRSF